MYDDDDFEPEVFDAHVVAKRVMEDFLIAAFQDADLLEVMNNDPECVLLLDEDWDLVLDSMRTLNKVHVKVS